MDFIQALLHFCSKQRIHRGRGERPICSESPAASDSTYQTNTYVWFFLLSINLQIIKMVKIVHYVVFFIFLLYEQSRKKSSKQNDFNQFWK